MVKTKKQIIGDIDRHLKDSGKQYYSEFYVGVSKNAPKQMLERHHVRRDGSWWIYRTAASQKVAREIEKHYLDLGMRGNQNSDEGNMVYTYEITATTAE